MGVSLSATFIKKCTSIRKFTFIEKFTLTRGFWLVGLFLAAYISGAFLVYRAMQWPESLTRSGWNAKDLTDCSFYTNGYGVLEQCTYNPEKKEVTLLLRNAYFEDREDLGETFSVHVVYEEGDAEQAYDNWQVGQEIRFKGTFSTYARASNPGTFDYRSYCFAHGIVGKLESSRERLTAINQGSRFMTALQNLRVAIVNCLKSIAEEEDAGILICILTGDKSLLTQEWKQLYQDGGILHLLSISGLHISVLGILLYQALRAAVGDYVICCGCAASVVGAFCLMVGSGTSVVRACICFFLYLGAEYAGRQYDLATAVAVAGLLILWDHPLLLFQSGFLMSFSCMFGIAFLLPVTKWMFKGPDGYPFVLEAILLQFSSLLVVLWFNGKAPLFGPVINLLTVPFMVYVLLSDLIAVLSGFFIPPLGVLALGPAHYILRWYEWICRTVENVSWAQIVTGRPEGWQVILFCLIAAAAYGAGTYCSCWKDKKIPFYALFLLIPCSLLILTRPASQELQITFLDVGQGDGIVISLPDGKGIFCIDGGSSSNQKLGEYVYEPFLNYSGIDSVDYWLITHPDGDHYSGLVYLLEEGFTIRHLLLPVIFQDTDFARALEYFHEVEYVEAGDRWTCNGVNLTLLHPDHEYNESDTNDASGVLYLQYGDFSALFTGDLEITGEAEILKAWDNLDVDILKLGHHGSKSSTSQALLDRITPETAIISAGRQNRYGHPHKEVLQRLGENGIPWINTAYQGAVELWSDGKGYTIKDITKKA